MSIKAVDLNYVYGNGTAFEQHALFDVNFEIQDGEFVGIIGHTGSGKSTLIQHLNGLIKASSGACLLYTSGVLHTWLVFQVLTYQEKNVLRSVLLTSTELVEQAPTAS